MDDQPVELIWKAPDGTSVLLSYLRDSYSNAANLTISDPEIFSKEINELALSISTYSASSHILLMHGTDHKEPSMNLTQAIRVYQNESLSNNLFHSNIQLYFDLVRSSLESSKMNIPEVTGELRSSKRSPLLPNVLSTHISIKQRNQACENDLLKWVEPFSAWVSQIDQHSSSLSQPNRYSPSHMLSGQKSSIRHAWKLLMQCHPHDSICATSIDQVTREMVTRFDQVDQVNHELMRQNLQKISDYVDTSLIKNLCKTDEIQNILSSIIIFNPNGKQNTELVSKQFKLDTNYSSIDLLDDTGKHIQIHQVDHTSRQLISMVLDKKGLKQALAIIPDGMVAGLIINDYKFERMKNHAIIRVTLSSQGQADHNRWRNGLQQIEGLISGSDINKFIIDAYSDPEMAISFIAKDVPAHGYTSYWIRGIPQQQQKLTEPIKFTRLHQSLLPKITRLAELPLFSKLFQSLVKKPINPPDKLENDLFIVTIERQDGTLSIIDKRNDCMYTGLNHFIDGGDSGDLYNYCPPIYDKLFSPKLMRIEFDRCDIYQKLNIHYQIMIPCNITADRKTRSHNKINIDLVSEITLVPGVARIDIRTTVDNQASDHRQRVHFPVPFHASTSWQDGHFEVVERPIGLPQFDASWEEPPRPEVPQREYCCVSDEKMSLTIANRGLPEVEVFNNVQGNTEIAITLLRCVGWLSRDDISTRKGHAGPMGVETPDAQMHGKYYFNYSIIPSGKEWLRSIHLAQAFTSPMMAVETKIHAGILGSKLGMIENSNTYFIISTIKHAEEGNSLIVRGFNILPYPIETTIQTWRRFRHAYLVSLDEKIIQELGISDMGELFIKVDGHKIVTLCFSD